ncbi:hypothetical protein MTO96_024857 [Rhipicephalus appendiculatus]
MEAVFEFVALRNQPEICLVLVPRMLMLFATIVVDLLLVIGIEDDSQYAMKIFVNWTALDVLVDSLICISLVVLKNNWRNGACAYLVRRYARARLAGLVAETKGRA